jgi:Mrp family chromosome partitioning ATPase
MVNFPSALTQNGSLQLLNQSLANDRYGLISAAGQVADWILDLRETSDLRQFAIMSYFGGPADSSLAAVVTARAVAERNARIVVVDLDANGSCIEQLFGLPNGPGFVDLLAGTADFTKVISRDPLSTAHLLRFGFAKNAVSMSLLSQRMDAVLTALGSIYDMVLVHAGEASLDTPSLITKCQAALILAPSNQQAEASIAAQKLSDIGKLAVQLAVLEPVSIDDMKMAANA